MSATPHTRDDGRAPAAVLAGSRAGTWSVVPQAGRTGFAVRDKLLATARGTLPVEDGAVVVDATGVVTQAWVRLSTAGIDTGNARRDAHLRTPRFLDAEGSPSITVRVDAVRVTAEGGVADAVVQARGEQAPVLLTVTLAAAPSSPGPADEVRLRVTGRLDRTPLGIGAPTVLVGRYLELEADLVLRRA